MNILNSKLFNVRISLVGERTRDSNETIIFPLTQILYSVLEVSLPYFDWAMAINCRNNFCVNTVRSFF